MSKIFKIEAACMQERVRNTSAEGLRKMASHWNPVNEEAVLSYLLNIRETWAKKERTDLEKRARTYIGFSEIFKACLFYEMAEGSKSRNDWVSATIFYYYSMFHCTSSLYKMAQRRFSLNEEVGAPSTPSNTVGLKPTSTIKHESLLQYVGQMVKRRGLLSDSFLETFDNLQKRRVHLNYEPRFIRIPNDLLRFDTLEFEEIPNEMISKYPKLVLDCIQEASEFFAHILVATNFRFDFRGKTFDAPEFYHKAYLHWGGGSNPSILPVGTLNLVKERFTRQMKTIEEKYSNPTFKL